MTIGHELCTEPVSEPWNGWWSEHELNLNLIFTYLHKWLTPSATPWLSKEVVSIRDRLATSEFESVTE